MGPPQFFWNKQSIKLITLNYNKYTCSLLSIVWSARNIYQMEGHAFLTIRHFLKTKM